MKTKLAALLSGIIGLGAVGAAVSRVLADATLEYGLRFPAASTARTR
jgi:phosphoglycerate dehydrogenase-like enzyme